MRSSGKLRVAFPDEKGAENALRALKGEEEKTKRMGSHVYREGKELVVEAEGADIVALRAALNAYLRYLQAMEGINKGGNDG
ncbi:MAG: KEOPS complex subunit Pcc1 [Candidatus Micrarchaeota archaeon]